MSHAHQIVPREKLDFGLDGDIPKYWFANDAFKSRFFDAMCTIFPEGERYFISCVRDYRDQVTDPTLREKLRAWEGRGAVVTMVMEASPSEAAGLRVGDAVLRANRVWIDSPSTMIRLVSRLSAGDDLELWTIRDGGILIAG